MDLEEIQRHAAAAREFTSSIDGATFTLRLPTRLDSKLALARVLAAHRGESNDVLAIRVERETLVQSLIGWADVPLRWVLRDAAPADEPCAFDRAVVGLLLDEQPGVAELLGRDLFDRIRAWNATRDTAAKN